ncbi:MAG: hypothetical protein ACXWMS_01800, partial [Syntrophales bacterium]
SYSVNPPIDCWQYETIRGMLTRRLKTLKTLINNFDTNGNQGKILAQGTHLCQEDKTSDMMAESMKRKRVRKIIG